MVRCEVERSQHQNRAIAMQMLQEKLNNQYLNKAIQDRAQNRRNQIGTGERSDKIRTVQVQNGVVINHKTGNKLSLKSYLKGDLSIAK